MGALPSLAHLNPNAPKSSQVVIVGCSEQMILSPSFRARVQQLSQNTRLIAVLPAPSIDTYAHAAQLGFAGLVAREVSPRALERTITVVSKGGRAFPRGTVNALINLVSGRVNVPGTYAGPSLTPRQEQVVGMIAQGATDREIATVLRISHSTAHKHVQNALRRFKAKTRSQLVAAARVSFNSPPQG
jgi:DNA-binding NarL/FixJ family response regulator